MDNHDLQVELLMYFQWGKPLRRAYEVLKDKGYDRQDIIDMKNQLLDQLPEPFLYVIPGQKTSGTMYRITEAGRKYLAWLQERMEA